MATAVDLRDVVVRRGSRLLLDAVSWSVEESERWVILGPNGAGKTTLLLVASARMFPTAGQVEVLGEPLGGTDLADLRPRIGWASSAMLRDIPAAESVRDVVLTGAYAVTGRWREEYADEDRSRAEGLVADWGLAALGDRTFGTLSEGERKRTLIARSLMANPELLLLDEPGAGLDLGGREELVRHMSRMALDPTAPTQVLVTHHVEEIPVGFTHVLLLGDGQVIARGPIHEVLQSDIISRAFAMPIDVRREAGRWSAVGRAT